MAWWWWLWLAVVIFLLLIPLSYGWGYRRWGAPYPRAYRGRRRVDAEAVEAAGWGILADFLWVVLVVALVWLILAWIF